ncbi:hypothetical protein BDY17DRAFT_3796 [Neohortaea acidophila]|uniref:Uncharacterized protein n=1 Tax=Neohortaea acidophila TaxID=245834 RepID=A0A6A6Q4B3_9PEZI|nr:uncharacterized protein BDY17DRAFT_3796 [Neohortaea acidophila]KAF2487122.1 hypothetical protein BDY17DRAFT_3796 [Neohortaea acidophila]
MAIAIPSSPIVEASSLATVHELAANPPSLPILQYPGAAPLILYIARVPGSRDVFLTPVRPREKVVTASDVQSSLYYVHINCAEPDLPAKPATTEGRGGAHSTYLPKQTSRRESAPPLPRRPVPPPSPPELGEDELPPLPSRPGILRQNTIPRKPVLPVRTRLMTNGIDLPTLPPRPLPPTPVEDKSPSVASEPAILYPQESSSTLVSGTLTLIRRNAGSNEQWNVATIHDPPVQELSSTSILMPTAKRRTKKGGAPMYLEIATPGYRRFIPPDGLRTESRISSSTVSSSESDEILPEEVFRRRLYMPGSKYAEHGYGRISHHRKGSSISSTGSTGDASSIPTSLRTDRHSVDFSTMTNRPSADWRSKGYTFTSPWDGQCEFTTGATGRTLKCRHHLPHMNTGQQPAVIDVSELRFNLPTSAAKSTTSPISPRASYFSDRQHLLDALPADGSQSPSIVLDENGRIDLSLGQERAGGGLGGKQAKLGKLIIEPEGLCMLDLLVASNLALWWRAWERV